MSWQAPSTSNVCLVVQTKQYLFTNQSTKDSEVVVRSVMENGRNHDFASKL